MRPARVGHAGRIRWACTGWVVTRYFTLSLDEFANIGRIPDFPTTQTVARGRNIQLVLGVQSLSQLEACTATPEPTPFGTTASRRSSFMGWTM